MLDHHKNFKAFIQPASKAGFTSGMPGPGLGEEVGSLKSSPKPGQVATVEGEEPHVQAAYLPRLMQVLRAPASGHLEALEVFGGGGKMAFGRMLEICEDCTG